MKKILYIAYFFPPASGAGIPAVQRIKRLINHLNVGQNFILTLKPDYYPSYIENDDSIVVPVKRENITRTKVFDLFELILSIRNLIRNFSKKRHSGTNYREDEAPAKDKVKDTKDRKNIKDIISSLLTYPDFASGWIFPAIFTGVRVTKRKNIDIIFATGMPWSSLLIGFWIKVFTGKKLIIDFRDPWVGNPFFDKSKIIGMLDRFWESIVVNKADLVLLNTAILRNEMKARYPSIRHKFTVLTNGYDKNDFEGLPDKKLDKDKLNILHAGFLYMKRDPGMLLDSISLVKRNKPDIAKEIRFLQLGNVSLEYDMKKKISDMGIEKNVQLLDQKNHKECLGYMKAADVLILIQPGTKNQIPSKLYEYIYLDKLIVAITERNSALSEMIKRHKFGEVFETNETERIAGFLSELYQKKITHGQITANYENKEKFDVRNLVRDLDEKIETLNRK